MAAVFRRVPGHWAAGGGVKRRALRLAATLVLVLALCLLLPLPASALQDRQAQDYLEQSPVRMEDFLADPIAALQALLADKLDEGLGSVLKSYGQVFVFLLLAAALTLAVPDKQWRPLLELLAAGGCFLLLVDDLVQLGQTVAEHSVVWRDFLLAFVPVFAGVMATGGEPVAGAVYNGFFLTAACALAELMRSLLLPATQCYIAVAAASVLSGSESLAAACGGAGRLLRRLVHWAGVAFAAILGLQRAFASAADQAAVQASRAVLTGAVPIVGDALSAAAQTVLAGVHTLWAGLGFAALAILGAEFLPLYLQAAAHLLLLEGGALAARLLGLDTCGSLLHCIAAGVEALAALLALFFGIVVVSTLLMLALGSGG